MLDQPILFLTSVGLRHFVVVAWRRSKLIACAEIVHRESKGHRLGITLLARPLETSRLVMVEIRARWGLHVLGNGESPNGLLTEASHK